MKKVTSVLALIPIVFFSVSGGPYGLEEIVSSIGPTYSLLIILILPIVWTIPECMIVAELSSRHPVQGGYYRWVKLALGDFWGFMEGWWSILYNVIDISLYPILFICYLKLLAPNLNNINSYFIELFIIWCSVILNILGIRVVTTVLSLFKYIILISFLIFIFCVSSHLNYNFSFDFLTLSNLKTSSLLFGISLAFWNFIGWDNFSAVLGEVEAGEKKYYKALFITIPIIVFFYFFPLLISIMAQPNWESWEFGQFTLIANSIGLPILGSVLAVGGMIMCLGLFNSMLLTSTRVMSTMSEDNLFFKPFLKTKKNTKTPYVAIIFSALMYSLLVLFDFKSLIVFDVFLYLAAMLLEIVALISFRKNKELPTPYFFIPFKKLGLYIVVGLACLVITVMFVLNLFYSCVSTVLLILALSSGIPMYLYFKSKQNTIKLL